MHSIREPTHDEMVSRLKAIGLYEELLSQPWKEFIVALLEQAESIKEDLDICAESRYDDYFLRFR